MRIEIVNIGELNLQDRAIWAQLQASNSELKGPCLRPELFAAVGRFHANIFVGVIQEGSLTIGFLPFYQDNLRPILLPVPLCDYQTIISAPAESWNVTEVLRAMQMKSWDFEHLLGFGGLCNRHSQLKPGIGYRIRVDGMASAGDLLPQRDFARRSRKRDGQKRLLERDVGPIRFVPFSQDVTILRAILGWKAQRFNQGRPVSSWEEGALEFLLQENGTDFRSYLSAVYSGDRLIAAHFGIWAHDTFYYWYPAFDPEFGKYSPGILLANEIVLNLGQFKSNVLDFGHGGEPYKKQLGNSTLPYISGFVVVPSALGFARVFQHRLIESVRSKRWLYQNLRPIVRLIRNFTSRLPF